MNRVLGDRYEIIDKIGGGGMAIVYLAKDTFLDRLVAVKVLRDEFVENDEFVRRFHKEAKAVASLNHINIVNIYDFAASGNPFYLVMEYVEGKTLKQRIVEEGTIPEKEAANIGRQIANGLSAAHQARIIHKDIKSQNIIFDKSGIVKITDFGIAQMLTSSTITHNKGILGSAHYFSPEQARGEIVDYRTDIYSLGVVLYEMLTGELPFTGDNPVTVALKHIQEAPVPPRTLNPNISPEMNALVLQCLAKNPEDRFSSMEAVSRALENIIKQHESAERFIPNASRERVVASPRQYHSDMDETLALPRNLTQKNIAEVDDSLPAGKKKNNKSMVIVLVALAVIFAFATVAILSGLASGRKDMIPVPSVVNMNLEEATEILKKAGLTVEEDEPIFSDEVDEGLIAEQYPREGDKIKKGGKVLIKISKGAEAVELPDFTGMSQSRVESKLKRLHLKLGDIKYDYSDEVDKDTVMSQYPSAGTEMREGQKVDLVISKGADEISLPDLRGRSLEEATKVLQDLGLSVGSVSEASDPSHANGLVLQQSPSPNSSVSRGSGINLTVNRVHQEEQTSKNYTVSLTAPENGWLTIEQDGRQVYQSNCSAGDSIQEVFSYKGQSNFRVYLNDKLIKEVSAS